MMILTINKWWPSYNKILPGLVVIIWAVTEFWLSLRKSYLRVTLQHRYLFSVRTVLEGDNIPQKNCIRCNEDIYGHILKDKILLKLHLRPKTWFPILLCVFACACNPTFVINKCFSVVYQEIKHYYTRVMGNDLCMKRKIKETKITYNP